MTTRKMLEYEQTRTRHRKFLNCLMDLLKLQINPKLSQMQSFSINIIVVINGEGDEDI